MIRPSGRQVVFACDLTNHNHQFKSSGEGHNVYGFVVASVYSLISMMFGILWLIEMSFFVKERNKLSQKSQL